MPLTDKTLYLVRHCEATDQDPSVGLTVVYVCVTHPRPRSWNG